jgi:hypothetical protein
MIFLAAVLGFMSLAAHAEANTVQDTTSISFTVTTTSKYQVTTGGTLQVMLNSIQLTNPPPQAYSFGVTAKTNPGSWITHLLWQFGDGAVLDVPYCCQSEVSEVQYHAYSQPGSYTVVVVAFDNAGNFGNAVVTVNWVTPIPEYPAYAMPLIASLLAAFFGVISIKKRLKH